MRISDWSSDVCSSDLCELGDVAEYRELLGAAAPRRVRHAEVEQSLASLKPGDVIALEDGPRVAVLSVAFRKGSVKAKVVRSGERRVGKECVSTWRSRWSP